MMRGPTSLMEFVRDDGSEALIEYTLSAFDPGVTSGPMESCYPPEGGDIEDSEATSDGVTVIEMTDAEWERAHAEIEAQPVPDFPDDSQE